MSEPNVAEVQEQIRDDFFAKAGALYEADAAAKAGGAPQSTEPKSSGPPSPPPAKPAATTDAAASKPVGIPGPPKVTGVSPQAGASPGTTPAAASSQPQQDALQTESEIPPADAFDKGPNRPQTKDWRALHAIRDNLQAQLQAARKEVETLTAKAAGAGRQDGVLPQEVQKRITDLETQNTDLLTRLESVAVERSPRFEAQFKPRQDAAVMQAKAAVGPENAARVEQLLQMPESAYRDQQIEALTENLSRIQSAKLTQAVADLDRLNLERQELSKRGSEVFRQWQQEQQTQETARKEEQKRRAQSTFDSEVLEWKDAGLAEDDLAVSRRVYFGGQDVTLQEVARAAMWVAYGPKAAAQASELLKENETLKAELAKLKSTEPGVATTEPKPGKTEEIPQNVGYAEGILQSAYNSGWRPS